MLFKSELLTCQKKPENMRLIIDRQIPQAQYLVKFSKLSYADV